MFTGIIEELGEVVDVEPLDDGARLVVRGAIATSDARDGDSIAVNGVCLTVTDIKGDAFSSDVMAETLSRSNLGDLKPGSRVNLERPVTLQTRLGGHLVQGHVDGIAEIVGRAPSDHWEVVMFSLPCTLAPYVVVKGSITIDGVSLTVAELSETTFAVSLIPTTLAMTTLGYKPVGATVNLEVDVVAKYVERLLATSRAAPLAPSSPPNQPQDGNPG